MDYCCIWSNRSLYILKGKKALACWQTTYTHKIEGRRERGERDRQTIKVHVGRAKAAAEA